nr:SPOR domain-containing protein [uncultured Rhodoferax sp.]
MATAPTTALDNTDEHSTTALYRAAIGEISNGYYLPRFTRFEVADRPGLGWNWAAALNTLNWLMFRQLWQAALVYSGSIVALALLLFGIGKLVFHFSEGTQWGLLAALVGLAIVVPGLGGNALYYLATRQRVQKALTSNQTVAEACTQLSKQASTRKGLIIIAVCNLVIAGIAAQSYALFAGFAALPAGTPVAVSAAPDSRHVASGRAIDGMVADTAKVPASAPAVLASAPAPVASAPASAPAAAKPALLAASTPAAPASAPAKLPASPASARVAKPAASASTPAASTPAVAASATPSKKAAAPASAPAAAPAKPSGEKAATRPSGPAPVALRSAAAESAAREVAAALGQPVPVTMASPRPAVAVATPALTAERFVVNVGLFADANNARNAMVKLMDAGLPVVSKEIRFPKGNRTRVQVGPFDTLAEADAAADKVRALALEARVAPLP